MIFFTCLITSLLAYSFSDKRGEEIDKDKRQAEIAKANHLDDQNRIIKEWNEKYAVNAIWDTLDYAYSIQYESIINGGYQLIEVVQVLDNFSHNDTAYASVGTSVFPSFYFVLKLTNAQLQKMLDLEPGVFSRWDKEFTMLVRIDKIRQFGVTLEADFDGEYITVNFTDSYDFFGRGDLIDIHLNKKAE